jgi:hypothetical protein
VIRALRHFCRKIGRPLLVVWDWLNAHRARRAAAFLTAHRRDFAVAYLPAYAPGLNPEEPCNAWVKRAMENALPHDIADPHRLARREFRRLQHRPDLIAGCFHHAGLTVTQIRRRSLETGAAPLELAAMGRRRYGAFVNCPRIAPLGWFLVCTFT